MHVATLSNDKLNKFEDEYRNDKKINIELLCSEKMVELIIDGIRGKKVI